MSTYAWIITTDHLADDDRSDAQIMGPGGITEQQITALRAGEGRTFYMYDDDGELYYTGRAVTTDEGSEGHVLGPLDDFGAPNAGCTRIRWAGHPEWS